MSNKAFEGRCLSKIKKRTGRFVWKIHNFSQTTNVLKSSEFPSSTSEYLGKWCLWLYPKGNDESIHSPYGTSSYNHVINSKPSISIAIYQVGTTEIWATVKISLINDKSKIVKGVSSQYQKFIKNSNLSFSRFLERDYILNKENGVLHNDEMTIVCDFEFNLLSENQYQEFVLLKTERPLGRLAKDMGKLLSFKILTDVTIRVKGQEFEAHKAILAARSPVFTAMFLNEMVEKKDNAVDVPDVNPDVFQDMLEYIYTDNEISWTDRTEYLLVAAEKYQLLKLKFMCEEALCKEISVDNVLDSIALAELNNASFLKEYAIDFLTKNRSDIIQSSSWDTFKSDHQSLAMEICEKICLH